MKNEEKKNWLDLYEIAKEIQDLKPWEKLWDADLFVYKNKDGDMYYFCVMGKGGVHTGINVYKNEQFLSYMQMFQGRFPEFMMINYQDCISMEFLSREDTLPDNLKLIKDLGLKFRGTWISFEKYEKGFEPRSIDSEDLVFLKDAFSNFVEMYKEYTNGMEIDFENGKAFFREFDGEKFVNRVEDIIVLPKKMNTIALNDELVKKLKKSEVSNMELEYDFLNYLPIRISDSVDDKGRRYYPRVRFIAEHKSGFILSPELINKRDYESENDYLVECVDNLIKFMIDSGLPKKIYVRDEDAYFVLKEFSDKLDINVEIRNSLPALDDAYNMFMEGTF